MRRNQLVEWLKSHTSDPRKALSFFTQGGFIFAGGLMGIILLNQFMTPSLKQEIAVLFCLLVTIVGGALALWGYLSISLFRILIYIFDREGDHDKSKRH